MVAVGVVVSMTQDIRDGHMQHNAKFPQQQSPLAHRMQGYSHARAQELLVHRGLRLKPTVWFTWYEPDFHSSPGSCWLQTNSNLPKRATTPMPANTRNIGEAPGNRKVR